MTQEEKAKRYDKISKEVKDFFEGKQKMYSDVEQTLNYLFPELRGSEDERIKEDLIQWIDDFPDPIWRCHHKKDVIAWLEKQGEQKTADEVEPKFHKGEWITNGDYTWKIVEVKPLYYILQSQDGNIIVDDTISHADEHFHSFTIKDAKEGDVLTYKNDNVEWILIYKDIITESCDVPHDVLRYHALFTGTVFYDSGCAGMISENYALCFTPATKEQRDALEWAMSIDGYKWNKEKLKLEKI